MPQFSLWFRHKRGCLYIPFSVSSRRSHNDMTINTRPEASKFGTKHQAADLLGLSPETLKKYRLRDRTLIEGIHWIKLNSRTIRYNLPLLADWLQNRNDSAAHQKAIEHYLTSLACNRAKRRTGKNSQSHSSHSSQPVSKTSNLNRYSRNHPLPVSSDPIQG